MTYTLEIPIDAAHMAEAEKKAWRLLGELPPGTPFRLGLDEPPQTNPVAAAEGGPEGAKGSRAWTKSELEWIEDGIVPASRRYDAEFVAAVKAKAEGKAQ